MKVQRIQLLNTFLSLHCSSPAQWSTSTHSHTLTRAHVHTHPEWNVEEKKKDKNHLHITDVQTGVVDAREGPHC